MPKVKVDIPQAEYTMICEAAWKLGLPVKTLIQQEVDAILTTISVWIQRSA